MDNHLLNLSCREKFYLNVVRELFKPYRCAKHKIWPVVTVVAWCGCLCVCLFLITSGGSTKTDEPIVMPFHV